MADEKLFMKILEDKIEWMGKLYDEAKDLPAYQWSRVQTVKHRCGGPIWVYIEVTGIGYVCEKCEDGEVL